jgi:hypothetical protein
MNKTITVKGKVIPLRIYARDVEHLQEMLKGRTLEAAVIDCNDSPVENAIPFLWAILQKSGNPADEGAAYDLYDTLVDDGYNAQSFSELLISICETSGFFAPARITGLRAIQSVLTEMSEKMMEKVQEKTKAETAEN